jgi:VWFA-related protein
MLLDRAFFVRRIFVVALSPFIIGMCLPPTIFAQSPLPYLNAGPNSVFAQIDFAHASNQGQTWALTEKNEQFSLVDSGVVSALDLLAPDNAVKQFKQAASLLRAQNSKDAIRCLERALKLYPDFVSAHNALGLAYLDQQDSRARAEFEVAAKLDDKFPGPFLNLGMLAIAANDFAAADSNLERADALTPNNPRILAALAFAQNGNHRYRESLETVRRVHAIDHRGYANVHYIAAAASMSLEDIEGVLRELTTFLSEDPANPLAPVARQTLDGLAHRNSIPQQSAGARSIQEIPKTSQARLITFPNSEYLRAQLRTVGNENERDADPCETCSSSPEPIPVNSQPALSSSPATTFATWESLYTIYQTVDETALFFTVSHRGRTIDDLSLSDIEIRDNNKPPNKILQFTPQSRLPLRLGLVVDTSDSVRDRFLFEKDAATKFIEKVLTGESDLAFVAGFNSGFSVTQDFTRDPVSLAQGLASIVSGGDGTALFDAVFSACWKLAAYPDQVRVAKVLVILTDGEDNASHKTLQQTVEAAEAAGVTVYTLNTSQIPDDQTDARQILRTLADRTGGESIFPSTLRGLDYYLNRLPDVIRNRYLVAYKPSDFSPDGKYRPVRVIATKDGKHLQVHVRKGYYARVAMSPN